MKSRGGAAPLALLIGGGLLITVAALVVGAGNVIVAVAPLLGVTFLYALWKLPLRYPALGIYVATLCLDSPNEIPFEGRWSWPLEPLARLFYDNLSKTTGIPVLRFSGIEALIALLLFIAHLRRVGRKRIDPPVPPTSRYFRAALLLSFGTVLFAELYGLARGGDVKESIWQFRYLLALPPTAMLFTRVLRGPEDYRLLQNLTVASALFKATLSFYAYQFVFKPMGVVPGYVTTHTDTVTYALAVAILLARWVELPNKRHLLYLMGALPWLAVGIITNDRRLAWVSIVACIATIYLVAPWNRAKRFVTRALVFSTPLWLGYVAVGWSSQSKLFKPVAQIRTMVSPDTGDEESASSEFRDLENYNLVVTIRSFNPLIGRGFGHEYIEAIPLPDISAAMPNYRFLPHNTVLWLWGIFGGLGYTALFLFVAVGLYFAARGYHWSRGWVERSACMTTFCGVVCYLNQAFGDMGTQSYISVMAVGPWLAVAAQQAIASGAWRDPLPARRAQPLSAPPRLTVTR